ncbi:MAG: SUMF1/EgtB/PvdO family nonheme iron enzyme, partial [Desulfobacterales bacterium]|nr:SUMF1/EgtB/PvdO family nonheme iron enzyme [Desulfobacterales bacterium]
LNISVYPEGAGTVTKNIDSSNGYEHGQTVTLTANPETGYVFDHWEGDLTGTSNPCDVIIDSEKNIIAIFVKKEYNLALTVTPQDAGEVEAVTLPVLQSIEHGEMVRLTAKPNSGYLFDHWEGDLTGNGNPVSLTMDDNKAVTAVFNPWQFLNIPMRYVPGAASFPTGTDDSGTCTTVNYAYWMAETEVTYEQWSTVYNWAVTHGYTFANSGTMGDGSGDTANHPVVEINSRDAMVWCNALTEYYNVQNSASLVCVYKNGGNIIQDATDATACDNVTADTNAKGFRLPTSMEWELAGRYKDGTNWTSGNYASGATADYNDANATGAVAWYNSNSGSSTHVVASKTSNVLGL